MRWPGNRTDRMSRCPPRAAVRQRTIAWSTLTCGHVSALQYRCRNLLPAVRMMSATSKGGRLMRVDPPEPELGRDSEPGVDRVGSSSSSDDAARGAGKESYLPSA